MAINNELSGDELMRLIEARERRAARLAAMPAPELPTDVLVAEPVSASDALTPELIRQVQQQGTVRLPPPMGAMPVAPTPAPEPRRMPLVAPPQPAAAFGSMTPEESQALAEMTLGQSRNARLEAVLPFVRAGQQINQAWTGAPVDVQGLEAMAATARRPEVEAAQRLALAREFAKRRMEGEQVEKQLAQRKTFADMEAQQTAERLQLERERMQQALDIEREQMDLRRQIEARQAEAERRRALAKPKATDALAQRKKELEVAKLEAELNALQGGEKTVEQQIKDAQLRKLLAEAKGEDPKKVKMAQASAQRMKSYISELKGLYQEHGPKVLGPVADRMKQLNEAITLEAKNIGELGALSGPDKGILQRIQGTPTTAFFRDTFGLGDPMDSLNFMENWVETGLKSAIDVYGTEADKAKQAGQMVQPIILTPAERKLFESWPKEKQQQYIEMETKRQQATQGR